MCSMGWGRRINGNKVCVLWSACVLVLEGSLAPSGLLACRWGDAFQHNTIFAWEGVRGRNIL